MPDQPYYGKEDQNASKSMFICRDLSLCPVVLIYVGPDPNQVAGGLKAAINNDSIPDSGKEKAQEKLDNM